MIEVINTVTWAYVINDLNGDEIIGTLYEKELQKTNQQEFRIEKVIERKGDQLYVKWKGYDSSFNSLIDKKDFSRCDYIVEKMNQNFPKLYELFGGDINVNVELQIMIQKLILKM